MISTKAFIFSAIVAASLSANSASITQSNTKNIENEISAYGSGSVVVSLFAASFDELLNKKPDLEKRANSQAAILYAELGDSVLQGGRWNNGAGQVGFFVTADGLKKLKASSNAVSVWQGSSWVRSSHILDSDGSLSDLNDALRRNASVEVSLLMNVDDLKYDVDKNGVARVVNSSQNNQKAVSLAAELIQKQEVMSSGAKAFASKISSDNLSKDGTLQMRLTRDEVVELSKDQRVRAMKRVGFTRSQLPVVNKDWRKFLSKTGVSEVSIELVSPLATGKLTAQSFENHKNSHKKIAHEVLSDLGLGGAKHYVLDALGVVNVMLTNDEMERLVKSDDKRIKAISPNTVSAEPLLSQSTLTINSRTWNGYGYTGAGQTIAVIDTGVDKTHPMMTTISGTSKVVYEGCFGTNDGIWKSPCEVLPGDTSGDSPDYIPNQGGLLPVEQCHNTNRCPHGLSVASIAAGTNVPEGFRGVAPDAKIASFRVASYDSVGSLPPTTKGLDIVAALNAIANSTISLPSPVPYIVNISLGEKGIILNGTVALPCNNNVLGIQSAINLLRSKGVPVVAATGNDGKNYGLNWPACEPGIIKVGATLNDGAPDNISPISNYYGPNDYFPNETLFFAPGDPILAAWTTPYIYNNGSGTSFAAPHVAGVYALVKQGYPNLGVDQVTAIISQYATPFQASACQFSAMNCTTQDFKFVHLP